MLGVTLAGGRMVAKVYIDRASWLPYGLQQPTPGSTDLWKYRQYRSTADGIVYPSLVRFVL